MNLLLGARPKIVSGIKFYPFSGNNKMSNYLLNDCNECIICGYKFIKDYHHIKKQKLIITLCPTHHHIIHRNLKDTDGSKLTLRQIIYSIKKMEGKP